MSIDHHRFYLLIGIFDQSGSRFERFSIEQRDLLKRHVLLNILILRLD